MSAFPKKLGPYQVLSEIARTERSRVYAVRQSEHQPVRALKTSSDADRLRREQQCLERLCHPSIVTLHDYDLNEGEPYIVLDYVPSTLRQTLENGPLDPTRAIPAIEELASAIAHAHGHNIIHGDLKPENVLYADHVKLCDFNFSPSETLRSSLATHQGAGTPGYLAPEQIRGSPATKESDVYCLGLIVYELLSGQLPALDPTPLSTITGVPAWIDQLFAGATAHRPTERPTSADLANLIAKNNRPAALVELEQLREETTALRHLVSTHEKRRRQYAIGATLLTLSTGLSAFCAGYLLDQDEHAKSGLKPRENSYERPHSPLATPKQSPTPQPPTPPDHPPFIILAPPLLPIINEETTPHQPAPNIAPINTAQNPRASIAPVTTTEQPRERAIKDAILDRVIDREGDERERRLMLEAQERQKSHE